MNGPVVRELALAEKKDTLERRQALVVDVHVLSHTQVSLVVLLRRGLAGVAKGVDRR